MKERTTSYSQQGPNEHATKLHDFSANCEITKSDSEYRLDTQDDHFNEENYDHKGSTTVDIKSRNYDKINNFSINSDKSQPSLGGSQAQSLRLKLGDTKFIPEDYFQKQKGDRNNEPKHVRKENIYNSYPHHEYKKDDLHEIMDTRIILKNHQHSVCDKTYKKRTGHYYEHRDKDSRIKYDINSYSAFINEVEIKQRRDKIIHVEYNEGYDYNTETRDFIIPSPHRHKYRDSGKENIKHHIHSRINEYQNSQDVGKM